MESIVELFAIKLSHILSRETAVFLLSMSPILELRGGLLAASVLKVPYLKAVILCIAGNIVPIPFLLLFLNHIMDKMEKYRLTRPIALRLRRKAEKNRDKIEKYGFFGLTLFVGIPLPGTGAWTGALVAALFHMKLKRSVPAILLGLLLATVIMSLVSYGMLARLI